MAGLVEIPLPGEAHGEREREGAPFPRRMKDRLVRLRRDRAEAMHAAEVVRAVHGAAILATPIMASRVTRPASAAASQCSVPAGRSGSTR